MIGSYPSAEILYCIFKFVLVTLLEFLKFTDEICILARNIDALHLNTTFFLLSLFQDCHAFVIYIYFESGGGVVYN